MATTSSAPGKIILVGEHAVVYQRPAIAVPVSQVVATATIYERTAGSGCTIFARDVALRLRLAETDDSQPLALVTRLTLTHLRLPLNPDWQIELHSTIPIASGLGSGAALSTALVRAIHLHAGQVVSPDLLSDLVFASERLYHGTPSGIDNTVIAYETPIWFVKGEPPMAFLPKQPLTIAIADSGIAALTKESVAAVRRAWQANPTLYEARFTAIAEIVVKTRQAMEQGELATLGALLDENQALLVELGVSTPMLERLIQGARSAGALGAKLSGGGGGGNVIALVPPGKASEIEQALRHAGATNVIVTTVRH
jgi:mevalonate kinase